MSAHYPEKTDIAIVGGGLVGCSLACALERSGLDVVLIEAAAAPETASGFDQRKLALAARSIETLQQLGVLERLNTKPAAIERIHISRVGDFGRVLLKASDYGHTAFGAVILAQELGLALSKQVDALKNTKRICPASVIGVTSDNEGATLKLAGPVHEGILRARWVIAADGTNSFIRNSSGVGTIEHDYQQTLFICSVQAEKSSDGTAYERFSSQGPVAMLPMAAGQYGGICGVANILAESVKQLSDTDFVDYLQSRFGWRLGKILRVGTRSHYPIKRVLADQLVAPSVFIIGNAAQTIHPIGAQGFNLGLRDAICLARVLTESGTSDDAISRYRASRAEDRAQTLAFSDGLARMTANDSLPVQALRSMGLSALGVLPGLASGLVTGAMGYRGNMETESMS